MADPLHNLVVDGVVECAEMMSAHQLIKRTPLWHDCSLSTVIRHPLLKKQSSEVNFLGGAYVQWCRAWSKYGERGNGKCRCFRSEKRGVRRPTHTHGSRRKMTTFAYSSAYTFTQWLPMCTTFQPLIKERGRRSFFQQVEGGVMLVDYAPLKPLWHLIESIKVAPYSKMPTRGGGGKKVLTQLGVFGEDPTFQQADG